MTNKNRVSQYEVAAASDEHGIEEQVKRRLREGFVPYGELIVKQIFVPEERHTGRPGANGSDSGVYEVFYQAMVIYTD